MDVCFLCGIPQPLKQQTQRRLLSPTCTKPEIINFLSRHFKIPEGSTYSCRNCFRKAEKAEEILKAKFN